MAVIPHGTGQDCLPVFRAALLVVCLGAGVCSGQQTGAGAAASNEIPRIRVNNLKEAQEALRAAQASHPENSPEVVAALDDVIALEVDSAAITEELLVQADRSVAAAEAASGKESALYSEALATRALALSVLDRPELARPMAEEALALAERVKAQPSDIGHRASVLSRICKQQRDDACGLRNLEIQVQEYRQANNIEPQDLAVALMELSDSRRRLHDMAGARSALDEALALSAHADQPAWTWETVENTAGVFFAFAQEYPLALEHLKRSLDMSIRLEGPDSVDQGPMLANLAYVELAMNHPQESLQYYAQARKLFARRYGPAHSETAYLDAGYGNALEFSGRYQEAIKVQVAAHAIERERIRAAIRLMPEDQALAMANRGAESYNSVLSYVVHNPRIGAEDVYQEVVRSRALVTEEMARREAALNRKRDAGVEALEQEFEKARKSMLDLQSAPPSQQNVDALSKATLRLEEAERELARRSAEFRAEERAADASLAELRAHMPAGSVLISYANFPLYDTAPGGFGKAPVWSYAAFVLHRDSQRIGVYNLGDAKPINALVKRMRASAEAEAHSGGMGSARNEREYRAAALELRQKVWDPLATELRGKQLALVVPDFVLNLVPFAALPWGDGYLVEHGPIIHLLTSERDLLPEPGMERKTGLVALGGAAFEMASVGPSPSTLRGDAVTCASFSKMEFQPLPASLAEVHDISAGWKRWNAHEPERLLTGNDATRTEFLAAAQQSRVLHVATHAFVLEKSCGNGNPLLHSGLVFAGANTNRNASILTAQQIASLDLRGVDWAVLSACNSGYGQLQDGEGVLGLERSFRVAGARSVIMALWPVDDESTRAFMRRLYDRRFARREPTATALWNSDRAELLARRAAGESTHPWYWAGFVAAGDWR